MTKIKREVRREAHGRGVFSRGQQRQVIITIAPPGILGFRLKGTRQTVWSTAEACYMMALRCELRDQQLAKARKAKKRKRGRR